MSKLRTSNGDDHPEAAQKHLRDAQSLLGQQRADGAAYLSGYVVECALKSCWQLETGRPWYRRHDLRELGQAVAALASVAGSKTARYVKSATIGIPSSAIKGWSSEMRYWAPTMSVGDATAWCQIAENVFLETVGQMRLDGVL